MNEILHKDDNYSNKTALIVKKVVEKAGENLHKQQQYSQDNSWNKTPNNDEVIYKTTNANNPRETKKVGDYVDYEEID